MDRRRIDQPLERRPAGQAEIDALAEMAGRNAIGGIALDPGGDGLRTKARRRDQQAGGQGGPALPARGDGEAAAG